MEVKQFIRRTSKTPRGCFFLGRSDQCRRFLSRSTKDFPNQSSPAKHLHICHFSVKLRQRCVILNRVYSMQPSSITETQVSTELLEAQIRIECLRSYPSSLRTRAFVL